jgi:Transglycosylase associated protein
MLTNVRSQRELRALPGLKRPKTYLGQAVGWYKPGEEAGFIGAIVGAIILLVVWGFIAPRLERT